MFNPKRMLACLLAGAMFFGTSVTALAADDLFGPTGDGVLQPNGTVNNPPTAEQKERGHSTFSIIEAKQNPNNVSFTVPLYVTMAVIEGQTNVAVPTNYSIVNTCKTSGVNAAGKTPFDIAVVKMEFTKLAGSSYNTVAGPTVSGAKNIQLQIGKVTMPVLSGAGSAPVAIRAQDSQFLTTSTAGAFASSTYKKIPAEPGNDPANPANVLNLELKGTVASQANLANTAAAAQFKVKYVISALDAAGKPLGSVYVGNDSELAGLGAFTPTP